MNQSPVWHPFTQHGLNNAMPLISRAEGVWLYGQNGQRWLDAISSWWVTTHGHGHPKIMAAIVAQTQQLDQLIFAGWTHEPAEQLARALVALWPDPLNYCFFSDSGSTSVEVALKMALGFWRNRSTPRHKIIVMEHSYHGDTIGAMSVGARGVFNQAYAPLLFDVARVPFPRGNGQETLDALVALCQNADRPAAFIVEPLVLGAGGMLMYPPETLKAMREVCAQHDVLFIADEVMTGWGRTGTLFACDQAEIVPDIVCLSKGITGGALPLAVTIASEAIYDAHCTKNPTDMFFHSSSYTANPIACAAANANLAVWKEEPVRARIAALVAGQAQHLAGLNDRPFINQRQCGTITAFDIANASQGYLAAIGNTLRLTFQERGVLLRPLGNTVYVMPPFCITQDELAMIYAVILDAIA